jgi:hypothetical protein
MVESLERVGGTISTRSGSMVPSILRAAARFRNGSMRQHMGFTSFHANQYSPERMGC